MHADPADPRILRPAERMAGYFGTTDHRAYLADPDRLAALADLIAETATAAGAQALSWDVFDTALLRGPQCEARRFYQMGARFVDWLAEEGSRVPGMPAPDAVDALLARAEAAQAAYGMAPQARGNREGRLDDIARIACTTLGCPRMAPAYVARELEAEAESLSPNPLIAAVSERLPGLPVYFLSDMYLSAPQIEGLVTGAFPALDIAGVWSSADGAGAKRSGGLFASVVEATGHAPAGWLHLGDSFRGDVVMPRKAGWNALYLPLPEAERAARRLCYDGLAGELAARGLRLDRHLAFTL